jgi:glycosyltransferase involved in cell wall biosynthesis
MKPFFSVVIPAYNRARELRLTLGSVLAQTFTEYEVLVMDDGSKDDTEAVVRSFGDPRIQYAWAANSGGPATPRNRGIEAAKGDWVSFLDADDCWYPQKLATMAAVIASHPDVDLICHNEMLSVLATGKKTPLRYGPFEPDFYRMMLMLGNRVSTSAATVRRAFLNEQQMRFNQSRDYVIVEDYDLWLRIALHGGVFHFSPEFLGEYVIADSNISSNLAKTQHNLGVLLRDHVYRVQTFEPDKDRLWREINAGLLITQSKTQLAQREFLGGLSSLRSALGNSVLGSLKYILMTARQKRPAASQPAQL